MTSFETLHEKQVLGKVTTFDRLIFKGHILSLMPDGAFARYLSRNEVLLKDFKPFVQGATEQVKRHAEVFAAKQGRPFIYLQGASTKASGNSKEDRARKIAEEDDIKEGLVAVFSVLEPCSSFDVRGDRKTHRLKVVRRRRKCLHLYFYFIDRELGWMHVRLQTWFPMSIQVYVNGREWLAKQLDARGIRYVRDKNTFLEVDDLEAVEPLCKRFRNKRWERTLSVFATRINPWLKKITDSGFNGYYWVIDQAEIATDVMFKSRTALEALLPSLFFTAITGFRAEDVLRFLGKKLHHRYEGETTVDLKKRPEGRRVKFRSKQNSLKMYDKASVLRVETTINNPREFKVYRKPTGSNAKDNQAKWRPMAKGVANLFRYEDIGTQANERFLDALGSVRAKGKVIKELDDLCQPQVREGKRFAKINPIAGIDVRVFTAIVDGGHVINGFRNRDIASALFGDPPASVIDRTRRCSKVSRIISKLRAHRLVKKVQKTRLYRVTKKGARVMAGALHLREIEYPLAYQDAA